MTAEKIRETIGNINAQVACANDRGDDAVPCVLLATMAFVGEIAAQLSDLNAHFKEVDKNVFGS